MLFNISRFKARNTDLSVNVKDLSPKLLKMSFQAWHPFDLILGAWHQSGFKTTICGAPHQNLKNNTKPATLDSPQNIYVFLSFQPGNQKNMLSSL